MLTYDRIILDERLDLCQYPVGTNMKDVHKYTQVMAELIEKAFSHKVVNLIARGSSGSIIATSISFFIDVERIYYVKKEIEKTHGESVRVWEKCSQSAYIIVDDFISSGETVRAIVERWYESNPGIPIDGLCVNLRLKPDLFDFHIPTVIAKAL